MTYIVACQLFWGMTMETLVFNDKEIEIIQLALKVFIDTIDKNNEAYKTIVDALSKRLCEYSEEQFASVHSQGG